MVRDEKARRRWGTVLEEEPSGSRNAVRIRAPARLHLGFLDLNGNLGRRFGSIGLSLDEPALDLTIAHAREFVVNGPQDDRIAAAVRAAARFLDVPDAVGVRIAEALPPHAGFGSGTQIALAAAAGLARLFGCRFDGAAAAAALDRGNRSGIGLAAFRDGGFIVDGGRDAGERAPPVVARHPFPSAWRVLLVLDDAARGVHGDAERAAFRDMPEFPASIAAHLCRVAMMQMLPALAMQDFVPFGRAVAEIQRRLGDHFAPFQGGGRYTSRAVAEVLAGLERDGVEGVGQTSWGPTGFALFESNAAAETALARLRVVDSSLRFAIARGRNRGADVLDCALEGSP
jgi:beta-RFAP synthase